ncbi:hypothetical protein ACFL1R_13135 [Candidatus Latescibacterota bacterium]
MIVVIKKDATREQIEHVINRIRKLGYTFHPILGKKL